MTTLECEANGGTENKIALLLYSVLAVIVVIGGITSSTK